MSQSLVLLFCGSCNLVVLISEYWGEWRCFAMNLHLSRTSGTNGIQCASESHHWDLKFRIRLAMKPSHDPRAVGATHGNLLAICHNDHGLSILFGPNFLNIVEIDDKGPVNAQECLRV